MTKGDVRSHILQVAGPIFATEGYQSTTVRKICEAAQVNVAAVNYYFGDKERLYIDAVKHARKLIEQRWPLPEWPAEMPPQHRLQRLIHTFVHRLLCPETEEWQMRLVLREIIEPTRACEEMVQEGFQPFFNNLLEILRCMCGPSLPAHELHRIGFSIISQCVFYRAHHRIVEMMIDAQERKDHFTADELAEHIFRFSQAAIEMATSGANSTMTRSTDA